LIKASAILFDLDGTLLDTKELILASYRYATRKVLGRQLPDEQILPLIGIPLVDQMRHLAAEHADELVKVYRAHNAQVHDKLVQYFEGTREALDVLRGEGRRLAVVTSKRKEPACRGLARFGLQEYFELIIGSDDTAKHKPDPEPLFVAAERLAVPIDTCFYVGDSPYDMQAARAAGAVAIAALWGMFTHDTLLQAGAQHETSTITTLPTLIQTIESTP
jgi:pyrophosphatase PpaX